MCLSRKGERASAQTKHFKRVYQFISNLVLIILIAKYVAVVTIIYPLANKYETTFLPQFPQYWYSL